MQLILHNSKRQKETKEEANMSCSYNTWKYYQKLFVGPSWKASAGNVARTRSFKSFV